MKSIYMFFFIAVAISACSKSGGSGPVPGKAELVAPLKDLTCNTGTVLSATESSVAFSWKAAPDATEYELVVTNLLTKTAIKQSFNTTNATVTLLRNTPYSWFVTSKSSSNANTTASDTWKFYNAGAGVISYAPFPAELLTPAFGAIISPANGKVNLTWKGSAVDGNITGYFVYFGSSANPPLYRDRITDSFVNDVPVSSNTTYYWRVGTVDANGNFSDSGAGNFFVK